MGYPKNATLLQAIPADDETRSIDQDPEDPERTTKNDDAYSDLCLKALCQVVREIRELIGMSQDDLAVQAKLHRTYISDIERGVRNFSVKTLSRIASSFDMTGAHLMRLAEERVEEWQSVNNNDDPS